MKRQLSFIFMDIKNNFLKLLIIFLQILLGSIILCYIIQSYINFTLSIEKLETITQNSNIYMLSENAESYEFDEIINNKELSNNQIKLYEYIKDLKIEKYSACRWGKFYLKNNKNLPEKIIDSQINKSELALKKVNVSPNFFEIFSINGNFNTKEVKNIFLNKNNNEIPILLGYSFKKYYSIGDIIEDNRQNKYSIIGFTEKGEYYIAPQEIGGFINLDNYVIAPISVDLEDSLSVFKFIISTNFVTEDEQIMQKIINKSNSLDLYPLYFNNFRNQTKILISDLKNEIMTTGAILLIIFGFASIGIIGYLIQYISDNCKEFGIHLLCGAEKKEIIYRIAIQIFIILTISMIGVILAFGFTKAVFLTGVINIIYFVLVLIYPISILKKLTIIEVIRGSGK